MFTDEEIKKAVTYLKNKFNTIKNQGYIKSNSNGRGNVGLTFEKLIGKDNDNFPFSDIDGIEIKVKHGFSKTVLALFSLVPSGHGIFETKRIRQKFGYPDKDFENIKVINRSVWSNYKNKLENEYKMSLEVNYDNKRIYLCFYNKNNKLVDKNTYWDFLDVKNALFRKMNILALVKAWPKRVNGIAYYNYYKINFYKLRTFNTFLKLLEQRKIVLNIQLGVFKSGPKKGQEHDHGITFGIKECDLLELYDEFNIE